MKAIKYNVQLKIETKDPKKELQKVGGLLILRFARDERKYREQLSNILQGKSKVIEVDGIKATLTDTTLEVDGIKFRKLINVRKFIDEVAEKYEAKCGPLNKSDSLYTKQCEGKGVKIYVNIKLERIKPVKKEEKQEKKEEKSEEKKESESKS